MAESTSADIVLAARSNAERLLAELRLEESELRTALLVRDDPDLQEGLAAITMVIAAAEKVSTSLAAT